MDTTEKMLPVAQVADPLLRQVDDTIPVAIVAPLRFTTRNIVILVAVVALAVVVAVSIAVPVAIILVKPPNSSSGEGVQPGAATYTPSSSPSSKSASPVSSKPSVGPSHKPSASPVARPSISPNLPTLRPTSSPTSSPTVTQWGANWTLQGISSTSAFGSTQALVQQQGFSASSFSGTGGSTIFNLGSNVDDGYFWWVYYVSSLSSLGASATFACNAQCTDFQSSAFTSNTGATTYAIYGYFRVRLHQIWKSQMANTRIIGDRIGGFD